MQAFKFLYPIREKWSHFFTKGHERSIAAKKNIAYSFIIRGISIAISLALIPLTINYVNPIQYGIWLTLSSILGWFSFFDIGFGNGFRKHGTSSYLYQHYICQPFHNICHFMDYISCNEHISQLEYDLECTF